MNKASSFDRFKMLTSRQKRLFALGFFGGVVLLLNTFYLLFSSYVSGIGKNPEVLPVFYQIMLLTHLLLGIIFVAISVFFVISHVRKILKMRRRRAWMRTTGSVIVASLVFLLLSGFFILSESNSKQNFWIFVSHQVLAAVLIGGYFAHRMLSRVKPMLPSLALWQNKKLAKTVAVSSGALAGLGLLLVLGNSITEVEASSTYNKKNTSNTYASTSNKKVGDQAAEAEDDITEKIASIGVGDVDPHVFKAVGDPDLDSPFYPATTTTSTGKLLPARIITHDDLPDVEKFQAETREKGFAPSYFLGAQSCQRCHMDIVQQWSSSAHRFSSFNNPFYRKSVELTRESISKEASQFCGGCHDPAIMLSGNMVKDIDPLTPESQAGLTCLGCHAIDKVHGVVGNGNYNIHDKTESPYIFDQAKSGLGLEVHDYVLKAKPTVHKQRNMKDFFQESEFCLGCHKVNLDKPVNGYRWLRGQNEYDSWHNSGVAHNQPKTWYEPPTVRQCQDCHMPLEDAVLGDVAADNGKVRSHRFLGLNTALPAIRGDHETVRKAEQQLRDNRLRLEIFAVRREDGSSIMSARDHKVVVKPGELIQVDVVVRNLNVGHTFPGGTNDSNEGWIDFNVTSDGGKVFHSGWVGEDRHVDPSAHFYKAVLVDKHGERIAKRNAQDIYAPVYANVIAPSTSDIARYRFRVPEDAEGANMKIDARLMWRKFNREFTEFVFEGQEIPNLPITEIEIDSIVLHVSSSEETQPVQPLPKDDKRWVRYNDYGIGSALDKDTKTASVAFKKVAELKPDQMDGYLNQARALISEGVLDKAEKMLRIASEKAPDEARLAFFWGSLLEKKGRLQESVDAYRRTLQSYPESRDTWVRLGRVYWLKGSYQDSIDAYAKVLEIDPEHALAFHQTHLAYKALAANTRDADQKVEYIALADKYKQGFDKYKIDENAAAVTHRYRERHPHDNRMSQTIVIHEEG